MTDSSEKAKYEAPQLIELGSFEELTQGSKGSTTIDGYYTVEPGESTNGHVYS